MRNAIALLLLTATAHAGNNELSYTSTTRALRTNSANAVTEDSLYGGGLAYARKINSPLSGLELWVHGTFGWGTADGEMFQTMQTQLSTLWLTASGQLRYRLTRHFVASGRLEVGTARASLTIHDDMSHSASDHGWGAISSAAVGIDCYVFSGRRYALSFRAELSAVATSSIPLTATPEDSGDDTLHLEMTAASLGGLNLSGPAFGVSAVFQF